MKSFREKENLFLLYELTKWWINLVFDELLIFDAKQTQIHFLFLFIFNCTHSLQHKWCHHFRIIPEEKKKKETYSPLHWQSGYQKMPNKSVQTNRYLILITQKPINLACIHFFVFRFSSFRHSFVRSVC